MRDREREDGIYKTRGEVTRRRARALRKVPNAEEGEVLNEEKQWWSGGEKKAFSSPDLTPCSAAHSAHILHPLSYPKPVPKIIVHSSGDPVSPNQWRLISKIEGPRVRHDMT
jgi:hypothetical protein